ncbi:MAG: MFS transporter [Dehalococcoidia bacterium]
MSLTTRADPEAPTQDDAPAERIGTFASLRLPPFRLLLAGTTLSNAAQWIQQVTLGWLVYELTGSGAILGSLNVVRAIATLGLAPVAGAAIDRLPPRLLMVITNGWLLTISLVLGLAVLPGHTELWWLFLFTFFGGVGQAIDLPLRQTIVFTLVPRAYAPNALALVQTGWAVMRSLGPAIGGVLILWFGPGGNFLVQASAYALIMLTIPGLRFPKRVAPAGPRPAIWRTIGDGLRYIAKEPTTRAFVLMGWVLPLFIIPIYVALSPIYAKTVFSGGPEVLGLLLSSVGIGGIAGGIVTASLGRYERRGLVQLGSLLLLGLSLVGVGLSPDLWLALPMLALSGFFELIFLSTNQVLLQLSIPDALRGRVMGIVTLNSGLLPIGAVIAGVGADLIGPRTVTIAMAGIAAAIAIGVFVFSPRIRDYRLGSAIAASTAER